MHGRTHIAKLLLRKAFPTVGLVLVVALHATFSATLNWASPQDGDTRWSNDANWSGGRAPGFADTAVFGSRGKRLAPCVLDTDAAVGKFVLRKEYASTFDLHGHCLSITGDACEFRSVGAVDGATDTLRFGTSLPSVLRARGNVYLDRVSVNGDVRLELLGDKQTLRLPKTFHLAKLVQSNRIGSSVIAEAGAALTIDTFVIRSGTLDLGGGSSGAIAVTVRSFSAAGGGITFGGSMLTFTGDTVNLSRLGVTPRQKGGGIEFGGTTAQVFIPNAEAFYPSIIQSGPVGTTILSTGFSCNRLAVVAGTLHLGTALSHGVSSRLLVRGALDFGTSTLSVAADSVDFSGAAVLIPGNGTVAFTGSAGVQCFVPKPDVLLPNLIKSRSGTVVLCGPCSAKKLWISDGTFDCGDYKCELTGFSAIGGTLAVGSDSLIVNGNALFSGLSGMLTRSGPVVVKASGAAAASVFSSGNRVINNLVLYAAPSGGSARIIPTSGAHCVRHCTFEWNRSPDSALFDFSRNNASLTVYDSADVLAHGAGPDKGCIYMGKGTWTFAGNFSLANYARDGSKVVFTADSGVQTVSAPLALGDVIDSGAGTLQLASPLKCRSFSQTGGTLDFNGNALFTENDFVLVNGSDTSIAQSKRGWKIDAGGDARLGGTVSNYLAIVNAVSCTVSAAGSVTARYAVLKNCRAQPQKGLASNCTDSLGNANWVFSNKPMPPTGLLARRGNGSVALTWNRSPSADALRYFLYVEISASPSAKRDSTDSAADTARTITKLINGKQYHVRVTVRDSAGYESDFSNEVCITPDSGLLDIGAGRVSFGRVTLGSIRDSVIPLWNGCSDTIVVSAVKISSAAFTSSIDSLRIPPKQLVLDTLAFRPKQQGCDSALIVLISNAASSPDTIRSFGTGASPHLDATPDTVMFESPGSGKAVCRTILIRNSGNDTLRISQVSRLETGDYVVDSVFTMSPMHDLAPGDSCVDTVRFAPARPGTCSALFLLKSNCTTPVDTIFAFAKSGDIPSTETPPAAVPKDFSFQEATAVGRSVIFKYALPVPSRVTLDVYNAIGRFIERPLENMQNAREYQFSWDGSQLCRGIYFCRFKAADSDDSDPNFTKTVRIVFSK